MSEYIALLVAQALVVFEESKFFPRVNTGVAVGAYGDGDAFFDKLTSLKEAIAEVAFRG